MARAAERVPDPSVLVIFGASGDLTARKLVPALYDLAAQKLLPESFAVVGFARTSMSDPEFRERMREALASHATFDEEVWARFAPALHYICSGEHDEAAYRMLASRLENVDEHHGTRGNRLYYLATPPSAYEEILKLMRASGISRSPDGWTRIVVEKPFGRDVESARHLDEVLHACYDESQVFRIDHYLGKETVQNLFVLRFANGVAEPLWNRQYVDHVQITVAESLGVEHRAKYYEEAGAIRDMLTNHLLQVLTLTAMEPPVDFEADAIRNEKVKVLHALELIGFVRGQYASGTIDGTRVPGYTSEDGVSPESRAETFVAAEFRVDNWRWAGVPFYLRHGKRLPRRATEIVVQFKQAPFLPFASTAVHMLAPNRFVFDIQPDEGITLFINAKEPQPGEMRIRSVPMRFDYDHSFMRVSPDAYQRLLIDAMLGDATLFTRSDEVMRQWQIVEPMLDAYADLGAYPAGSWGPEGASDLIERDGREWYEPA